jgi:hypothetical protein
MHVNSWLQKFHGTQKIMVSMTNIGAINSKHIKIYGVTKIMDCHENL